MDSRPPDEQLRARLADRLREQHEAVAAEWLRRLRDLLSVRENDIFPSHRLLDHIPNLIAEIGRYLAAGEADSFSANTQVFAKAAELGDLRFDQGATIHQLLREYDLLSDVISEFVVREVSGSDDPVDPVDALRVVATLRGAIRVLQQRTIDRFVSRYADLVKAQTSQLRDFNLLISHEIRQPLGVLRVTAELLERPDAHVEQFAATLSRNVMQLTQVVTKLERLAGLGGDSASMTEQPVEVAKLARDVAAQLRAMAEDRGVTVDIREPLPVLVADPARMELVFTNLLANAIKYCDDQKTERRVVVRPSITGDERVAIAVEDNGVGLPDGAVRNIFDRYFRVPGREGDGGFGLGLAIVRECMTAMDGEVRADSRQGEGTTFVLTWPVARLGRRWPAGDRASVSEPHDG